MLADQTSVANKDLWPPQLREAYSYQEQIKAIINKLDELEARIQALENEQNNE